MKYIDLFRKKGKRSGCGARDNATDTAHDSCGIIDFGWFFANQNVINIARARARDTRLSIR